MYWFETSLTFILAIAIMMRVDWRLAMFAILPAPAVSFAVIVFGREFTIASRRYRSCSAIFRAACRRIWRACA